jgi:hypothetical protein
MLIGNLLAYLDIFSILLLLSVIGRVSAIVYVVRRMAERVLRLASVARTGLRRLDSGRQARAARSRKPPSVRASDEDDPAPVFGLAWA